MLFLPTPDSPDSSILSAKLIKTRCFDAFPKAFQIEDVQTRLFLQAPERLDSLIVDAKLGVMRPSQGHFKEHIFKYIIPAHS